MSDPVLNRGTRRLVLRLSRAWRNPGPRRVFTLWRRVSSGRLALHTSPGELRTLYHRPKECDFDSSL